MCRRTSSKSTCGSGALESLSRSREQSARSWYIQGEVHDEPSGGRKDEALEREPVELLEDRASREAFVRGVVRRGLPLVLPADGLRRSVGRPDPGDVRGVLAGAGSPARKGSAPGPGSTRSAGTSGGSRHAIERASSPSCSACLRAPSRRPRSGSGIVSSSRPPSVPSASFPTNFARRSPCGSGRNFTYEQIGADPGGDRRPARWRDFAARRRLHEKLAAWDPDPRQSEGRSTCEMTTAPKMTRSEPTALDLRLRRWCPTPSPRTCCSRCLATIDPPGRVRRPWRTRRGRWTSRLATAAAAVLLIGGLGHRGPAQDRPPRRTSSRPFAQAGPRCRLAIA